MKILINTSVDDIPKNYLKDCKKYLESITKDNEVVLNEEESDAIIYLPGNFNTILDIFKMIECRINGNLDKPIIIYNSKGFYTKLILFLAKINIENSFNNNICDSYHLSNSYEDSIEYIKSYKKKKKYLSK